MPGIYKKVELVGTSPSSIDDAIAQGIARAGKTLEQLRWLENGYTIKAGITHVETIGIDTPQDLQRAEEFLRQMNAR